MEGGSVEIGFCVIIIWVSFPWVGKLDTAQLAREKKAKVYDDMRLGYIK